MILAFFPLKKLRRNGVYLLFGAILLVGAVAVYHEMVAANTSLNGYTDGSSGNADMFNKWVRRDHQQSYSEDSAAWINSYIPQAWKPEYEGQANLHVFEDWCGGSTAELRKNLHYPLYPHSRTTVKKLAVSPRWTNYGLRIFGYLHPYTDGEFVFALSSEDNSELWLSTDESPLNLQLLAWVGKTGTEWTAPGEFDKYVSQSSRSVWLSSQRRYFFEVIHKQNNKGTDHVEVAWRLQDEGFRFMVIESKHISLYVNETNLLMSDVSHIPQTAASHQHTPTRQPNSAADMLREDPRDSLYKVPLIKSKYLHGVLPDCSYKPSYTIKDFPLMRYQGLQFIHMSYIYPNDYTRLTNMESENSCFYARSTHYMEMFGFSRYMRLDFPEKQEKGNIDNVSNFGFRGKESVLYEEDDFYNKAYQRDMDAKLDQMDNALFPDYGYDYDDYVQKRRRKLLMQETNNTLSSFDTKLHIDELQWKQQKSNISTLQPQPEKQDESQLSQATQVSVRHQQQNQTELKLEGPVKKVKQGKSKLKRPKHKHKVKLLKTVKQTNPLRPDDREPLKAMEEPKPPAEHLSYKQNQIQRSHKMNQTQAHIINDSKLQPLKWNTSLTKTPTAAKQQRTAPKEAELQPGTNKQFTTPKRDINRPIAKLNQRDIDHLKGKQIKMNKPPQQDLEHGIRRDKIIVDHRDKVDKWGSDMKGAEDRNDEVHKKTQNRRNTWMGEQYYLWGAGGDFEVAGEEPPTPAPVFDPEVVWSQTFQVDNLNLQARRSDLIDLSCNVSGNLLLHSSDALSIVKAFMEQLNKKHQGQFTLDRVVNVVKRLDGVQGSRYLLELELKDVNGQLVRLSQYIYTLFRHSRQRRRDGSFKMLKPELVLCNPVGFRWNPFATVHFVVPVKNQARWVQQLIADMEKLFRETGDNNFNLIIADYNSTDMDVRKALQKSSLPRYQYVKLSGNFERSAGLQAGINLINDDHSIVFLCDLHIDFPSFMIDTIRKHCVEGYMAFAPIVMRLDCGSPPSEARGYWEVNGFGLLAIYKSDLDAVGGMNTKEFTDRWGGEDWELLDRILQGGLEVERIYLRNFFHHHHSKRGMWNRRMSTSRR